ncbi:MAG TPA: ABC transporter substrate-binding protein [Gaiellaceae bacterium]|nr:ABC transporter substrate-binding protein [Gaiellaceae bacterium]
MSRQPQIDEFVHELSVGRIDRRTFLQRVTAAGYSLGVAGSLAAAVGAGRARAAEDAAGTLRIRSAGDVGNLDPAFVPGLTETVVMTCVYEGLVGFKPGSYKVVPVLADKFELSKDGKRIDFTLRKGIQFHGGYGELTAADVKFSYERTAGLTSPPINSPYQTDWAALAEVHVRGKYSGRIILKNAFAPLMTNTLPGFDGYIVSKKAVEDLGANMAHHPIGTGPYEFVSWTPGQKLVLKKFARYGRSWMRHAKAPIWSQIHFIPIPLASAAAIAIESGAVDWGPVGTDDIDHLRSLGRLRVQKRTTLNYSWIGMNQANPALRNINVRRAIRSAIDVPGILQAAFNGKWRRATALLAPGMAVGHWHGAPVYKRNVSKAKAYLAKAGQAGRGLHLTMAVKQTDVGASTIAQIVQANLADIGIKVDVLVQDRSVFNRLGGDAQKNRQLFYEVFTTPTPEPSFATEWFTCDQLDQWNWMSWCNRQFSNWDAQAVKILNPKRRSGIYVKMQKLWDQHANTVWVAWPTAYFAGKKQIRPSLQPSGLYQPWDFRLA